MAVWVLGQAEGVSGRDGKGLSQGKVDKGRLCGPPFPLSLKAARRPRQLSLPTMASDHQVPQIERGKRKWKTSVRKERGRAETRLPSCQTLQD